MPRYIEFIAEDEGISARALLWDERVPRTCELVWNLLPVTGPAHHGIYSGAEIAMNLPHFVEIEAENATWAVLPWEIGCVSLRQRDYVDLAQDISEFCFFYDRGARPSMMEGPVKVNLFAQFVGTPQGLYELCYRMRREGQKLFTVRRVVD
jgi:hypothetical protein